MPKRKPLTLGARQKQINVIEEQIRQKTKELDKIKGWITGIGTTAGGLGGGLITLGVTKNTKIAKKAAAMGAAVGAERGHAVAEAALNNLQVEIDILNSRKMKLSKDLRATKNRK